MIEINAVSKTYQYAGKVIHALRDVTLTIAKRDIYGMIGLSGAGKSTLIRCLTGLIKPSAGTISFHNNDISRLKGKNLRGFHLKMGMIFQHFNLLTSRTVTGNITYPLEIAGVPKQEQNKRVEELLGLVGLSSKKDAYPSSLSGGEKQRVGIPPAFANPP